MGKIVVFNAPPGVGKDCAVDHLIASGKYEGAVKRQFKDRLFEITCAIHGVSIERFTGEMYSRENKEKPYPELMNMSPREALIHTSEKIIKPNFSPAFFGRALSESIDEPLTFVPDSGFLEEVVPVAADHGTANVLVARIFREGFDYSNDSRSYLDPEQLGKVGIITVDIINEEGKQDEFLQNAELVVDSFLDFHMQLQQENQDG